MRCLAPRRRAPPLRELLVLIRNALLRLGGWNFSNIPRPPHNAAMIDPDGAMIIPPLTIFRREACAVRHTWRCPHSATFA